MNTEGATPWAVKLPGKARGPAPEPMRHIYMRNARVGKTIELATHVGGLSLNGVRAKSTREAQAPIKRPAWHVLPRMVTR